VKAWKRLVVAVLVAVAVCAVSALVVVADDVCYTDLRISGTGNAWVDRNHAFSGMVADRPEFNNTYQISPFESVSVATFYDGAGRWICSICYDKIMNPPDFSFGTIVYMFGNTSDSATPPQTGWELLGLIPGGVVFDVNTPTMMSGGEPCSPPPSPPLVIIPMGEAGPSELLDVVIPIIEGEEPLMAGTQVLTAIHEVGAVITGNCQILGATGYPTGASYIHVYLYSVDIATRPETVVLLSHWMAHFNRDTLEYEIAVDTMELAPGYYDIYLSFQDGTAYTFRIQLIPAE